MSQNFNTTRSGDSSLVGHPSVHIVNIVNYRIFLDSVTFSDRFVQKTRRGYRTFLGGGSKRSVFSKIARVARENFRAPPPNTQTSTRVQFFHFLKSNHLKIFCGCDILHTPKFAWDNYLCDMTPNRPLSIITA